MTLDWLRWHRMSRQIQQQTHVGVSGGSETQTRNAARRDMNCETHHTQARPATMMAGEKERSSTKAVKVITRAEEQTAETVMRSLGGTDISSPHESRGASVSHPPRDICDRTLVASLVKTPTTTHVVGSPRARTQYTAQKHMVRRTHHTEACPATISVGI